MRLELEGVRRLVQRQPHAELVAWQPEGVLGCLDIWLNIVEAAGAQRLAAEEREVVLSEYLAREVAEEKPDLGAEHFLVERAEHLPRDRAVRRLSQKAEPFQRREHALKGVDVGIDPVHAVESECALRRVREVIPGVLAHDWHAAGNQRAVLRVELAPVGHRESLIPAHRHRDVPRGAPVDEGW